MVEIFEILNSKIYELNITVVSPSSNETLSASGYFMKSNKLETSNKITELRNDGNCPIPENVGNYYGIRHSDYDDTPCKVENFVAVNNFGTIIMNDDFSNWFNANTKTEDRYVNIEKMEIIDHDTKEAALTMEKF
jgi:hypothetical protein